MKVPRLHLERPQLWNLLHWPVSRSEAPSSFKRRFLAGRSSGDRDFDKYRAPVREERERLVTVIETLKVKNLVLTPVIGQNHFAIRNRPTFVV